MASGGFADQVQAFVDKAKARMEAVRKEAMQDVVEVMQEPGYSVATVKQAIGAGAGLGKEGSDGQRAASVRKFGPIANPGGAGNMPIDTGWLRASLVATLGSDIAPLRDKPGDPDAPVRYDASQVNLVIANSKLSDTVTIAYTANYAQYVEFGARGRPGPAFVRLAVQQWPAIVARAAERVKAQNNT